MPGDFILAWMPSDWMTGDWQGMPGDFIHAWMPGEADNEWPVTGDHWVVDLDLFWILKHP